MKWYCDLLWEGDNSVGVRRESVKEHASMIEEFLLLVLQDLTRGRTTRTRIADVLRNTAQQEGEWTADILEVWPVVHALELHLQNAIHHFAILEAILKHEFLDNNLLFSNDALQKYVW
jgi:hypothetical protein